MKYIINKDIDLMSLGNDEGTVLYDNTTENTFILDEIAADILSCFYEANDLKSTVDYLVKVYGDEGSVIQDTHEFFNQLIQEKILIEVNT